MESNTAVQSNRSDRERCHLNSSAFPACNKVSVPCVMMAAIRFLVLLQTATTASLAVQYFLRENSTSGALFIYIYNSVGKQLSFPKVAGYCTRLTEGVNYAFGTLPNMRFQDELDFVGAIGEKVSSTELYVWTNTIVVGDKCFNIGKDKLVNRTFDRQSNDPCKSCYPSCCAIEFNAYRKTFSQNDCNIERWPLCLVVTTRELLSRTLALLSSKID